MSSSKPYGLITKKSNQLLQKTSVFGDDSDSDPENATDWVKKALRKEAEKGAKRHNRLEIERALEEDSTVFQYDEVYDDMAKKKQETTQSKTKDRKPKYIGNLLKTAERRKIENDRRIERQAQKEREAEGEEFRDKETFVTSAYKKKLEEFAKLDAEQKRMDYLEEIGDVTKQDDISGFYRHLYSTTVGGEKKKVKPPEPEPSSPKEGESKKDDKKEGRHYRRRNASGSSEDKNKDADTDHSSSSSSSSSSSGSDSDSDDDKSSESEGEEPEKKKQKGIVVLEEEPGQNGDPHDDGKERAESLPKAPEKSIWEKRTVGEAFDNALKRYLERKANRMIEVHF